MYACFETVLSCDNYSYSCCDKNMFSNFSCHPLQAKFIYLKCLTSDLHIYECSHEICEHAQ